MTSSNESGGEVAAQAYRIGFGHLCPWDASAGVWAAQLDVWAAAIKTTSFPTAESVAQGP
eukprot:6115789-Pyramimonas_sp.AAC.1